MIPSWLRINFSTLALLASAYTLHAASTYDICIYGGTSAAITAACAAKKLGKSVVIIEPTAHIGGMTTGGLANTDVGVANSIIGMTAQFYQAVGAHYGNTSAEYNFEPKVALGIYNRWIDSNQIAVIYQYRLKSVVKGVAEELTQATFESCVSATAADSVVNARVFLDCSYEGDLMAKAGVSFTIGREGNAIYGETINGVQQRTKHQFPDGISPYIVAGDASSGLIPGIGINPVKAPDGSGDTLIQAYNYRLTVTKVAENRVAFPAPASYDPLRYELLGRVCAKGSITGLNQLFSGNALRNSKYDWNNQGSLSTDFIGGNYDYPKADYQRRAQIWEEHKQWILGLVKFIQTDSRVPQGVKNELAQWGLCKDEYADNGHWPYQLYVREARRMVSDYVMTEHNCNRAVVAEDAIGYGSYKMDSHNCQRVVVNGMIKNEGDVQALLANGAYPISYRSIVPKIGECTNLLVPVCLSASHIAYGSIRMEPVFMMLGEAAGIAAAQAIDENRAVQAVSYRTLAKALGIFTGESYGIVMDCDWPDSNGQVTTTGSWTSASTTPGHFGSAYLHDGNTDKGAKRVRFQPRIATGGSYDIYIRWTQHDNRATNVPVKIGHAQGSFDTTVNQRSDGGKWVFLGNFSLNAADAGYVEISNAGTDGYVIADAVLFVPEWSTGVTVMDANMHYSGPRVRITTGGGQLHLSFTEGKVPVDKGLVVELFGLNGRQVLRRDIARLESGATRFTIQTGGLARGSYVCRIGVGAVKLQSVRVVFAGK